MPTVEPVNSNDVHFPGVYREKYWGAAFSTLFVALLLLVQTAGFDPHVVISIAALLLFGILQLITTRIVLQHDRIESISLVGRRSLKRSDIERVEFRESKVKGKIVKTCFLISRNEPDQPMSLPVKLTFDETWFDWMRALPEVAIPASEGAAGGMTTLLALLLVGWFVASMIIPITYQQLKPYFDLFYLLVPWMVVLSLVNPTIRGAILPRIASTGAVAILFGSMAVLIAPVYLGVQWQSPGRYVIINGALPFTIASIVVPIICLLIFRSASFLVLNIKRETIFLIVAAMGVYGYTAALTVNSWLGATEAQTTPVRIQSKYMVTSGKSRGPYFTLAAWGDEPMVRTFRPSQAVYDRRAIGDRLCASLYQGALGVRWYSVTEDCP